MQLTIPMPAQTRNSRRESPAFHRRVVSLRKKGFRVYRNGKWTSVNGKRLSWRELARMAG